MCLGPSNPPININVSVLDSTAVNVEWDPPAPEDQNGVITGYQVQYYGVEVDTDVRTENVAAITFSVNITGLEAGSNYSFSVRVLSGLFSGAIYVRTNEIGKLENTIMNKYYLMQEYNVKLLTAELFQLSFST